MDVWTTLLSGGVGLVAGQLGSWLQSRRDGAADERRQAAETERLRMQLADAARQHERNLNQTDVIEWRERRLAIYQDVSSALRELDTHASRITELELASDMVATAKKVYAAWHLLDPVLDRCQIVSTQSTREVALSVAIACEALSDNVRDFVQTSTAISKQHPAGELAKRIRAIRASRYGMGEVDISEYEELARRFAAVVEANDKVFETTRNLMTAARTELGVPAESTPPPSP